MIVKMIKKLEICIISSQPLLVIHVKMEDTKLYTIIYLIYYIV